MKDTSYLSTLEAESIYIMREVAAQFERPALLFSGGKDSIVLVHLAVKAFQPMKVPFKLLHVDTGHNFEETLKFRDYLVEKLDLDLVVAYVQDDIDKGVVKEEKGKIPSRNSLQTTTLLRAIEENKFDGCIGGARRDEEKARAKERFFSVRDEFGQWNPKLQRPEIWNQYNGMIDMGENVRTFPLNNWTEIDVWNYIQREEIELPELYYTHQRECIFHQGFWFPMSSFVNVEASDQVENKQVRFRTIGDMTCTAAMESEASTLEEVIEEIAHSSVTERGSRMDDKRSEVAMENRKREGYF
jgi:sulfate adenylyltransferase subunit 2